jgi:hypothetical protein
MCHVALRDAAKQIHEDAGPNYSLADYNERIARATETLFDYVFGQIEEDPDVRYEIARLIASGMIAQHDYDARLQRALQGQD